MWKPYLKVIAEKLPTAVNILDRFHTVKKLNGAVDQFRREEVKKLQAEGYEPILKYLRYCFVKREENLTTRQRLKLDELLKCELRSVLAYLLKESFDALWRYKSPYWAPQFLRKWCTQTMRSQLDSMKKFVKTLRAHEELILNYFRTKQRYSSGAVEGLNLKVNLAKRKAYRFKSFEALNTK